VKRWTGWNLGDVRRALAAVGAVTIELDGGAIGHVLPGDLDELAEPAEPEPLASLLPALDPTPMGWQARDWYLPQAHRAELFDRTGNVGPTVWWAGEVGGGWAQRADGEIVWRLLADVGPQRVHEHLAQVHVVRARGGVRQRAHGDHPQDRPAAGPADGGVHDHAAHVGLGAVVPHLVPVSVSTLQRRL
jgi:hypothetical protein